MYVRKALGFGKNMEKERVNQFIKNKLIAKLAKMNNNKSLMRKTIMLKNLVQEKNDEEKNDDVNKNLDFSKMQNESDQQKQCI